MSQESQENMEDIEDLSLEGLHLEDLEHNEPSPLYDDDYWEGKVLWRNIMSWEKFQ